MKRSKLQRSKPLGSRSPMKRGRKRSAAEQERIYGPRDFRDWLYQQPCVITGLRSHIEQVHVIGGGVGRKAGWTFTVPMTDELHRELHQHGVRTFERKWGVNLVCLAGMIQDRWEREQVIAVLHTTDPLCARCQASFREEWSVFCGSCQELNRQERAAKAQKRPPRDAA